MQNKIYIQRHDNIDLFSFRIFFSFTKFYSLRNSGLQVTDIQEKRCRVFLEVISSTD